MCVREEEEKSEKDFFFFIFFFLFFLREKKKKKKMLKGFRRGRDRPHSHIIQSEGGGDPSDEIEDRIRCAVDNWMGEAPPPPPEKADPEKKPKKHKSEKRLKQDVLEKKESGSMAEKGERKGAKGKEKKKRNIKLENSQLEDDIDDEGNNNDNNNNSTTKLFGVPVEVAARRSDKEKGLIPLPIRNGIQYLNEKGMEEEGLYRVPGSHNKYLEYRDQFDEGEEVNFFVTERVIQNVAMMVIKFLKDLPEPLYTEALQGRVRKVLYGVKDKEKQKKLMKKTMAMLPLVNREIFRYVVDHFRVLGAFKSEEQMRASILSWGISLGRLMGQLLEFLYESEEVRVFFFFFFFFDLFYLSFFPLLTSLPSSLSFLSPRI